MNIENLKEGIMNNEEVMEKESEIMLKIIDSQMGAGKTSYLIEKMKKDGSYLETVTDNIESI